MRSGGFRLVIDNGSVLIKHIVAHCRHELIAGFSLEDLLDLIPGSL